MMIENGPKACFMKDKKGYLPAHVASSRHCSPEKLQMLLDVNPNALEELSNDGHTLLSLAIDTATRSHPNYALIDLLRQKLDEKCMRHHVTDETIEVVSRKRKVSDDESAAGLLMHFAKQRNATVGHMEEV